MNGPASPASGTPGEFGLDLDLAAEAVRDLEDVRQQLLDMRVAAAELARVTGAEPSARDSVSLEAFALLAEKAGGGPGSLSFALDAGIGHVEELIAQMNADIAAQRSLDRQAERELRT